MDWKVSREQIEVMVHPNAENLEICKVGQYPLVSQKGLHKTGDVVIFIPEKSILPEVLWTGFKEYLKGPNKDRVGSIRLRGEPSMGIVIPDREEFKDIPFGEDISGKLGIVKFEPPVPVELAGRIKPIGSFVQPVTFHDVESYTINKDEFIDGESVIITEKCHGSQLHSLRNAQGEFFVSSKGMIKRQWVLEESETNSYWRGAKSIDLKGLLDKHYPNINVEAYGELLPTQKGFSYGFVEPTIKLFDIRIDGNHVKFDDIPEEIRKHWVPILYRGPLDRPNLFLLKEGREFVSGKHLHIKEGIVLRADPDRYSTDKNPFRLMVKLLNSKYKETGEEVS